VDSAYQQRLDELQYLRYEANTRARTITNRLRRQAARGAERPAVRWGILGLGQMAHTFAKALNCVPGAELVAVASRSVAKAQAFAAKHSVRHSFGNYADMLRADNVPVDVVYVSTPVDCHYDHTKMCLQMGKNVLCEKPITLNAEQCESLTELAGANGTFLMEGMWMKCLHQRHELGPRRGPRRYRLCTHRPVEGGRRGRPGRRAARLRCLCARVRRWSGGPSGAD
jgi:hypothetical protein